MNNIICPDPFSIQPLIDAYYASKMLLNKEEVVLHFQHTGWALQNDEGYYAIFGHMILFTTEDEAQKVAKEIRDGFKPKFFGLVELNVSHV